MPGFPVEYIKDAEPIELTLTQGIRASADNRFAFSMFKEVSEMNGENTFFSPLSLAVTLGMLYNGASGDTRTEMAEALCFSGFTETDINEYYQKILQALLVVDPLTDMGIANSIWYREGFSVKQTFIDINKTFFDALVQSLDFEKTDAKDIINTWCAEKTKNNIREIIDKPIRNDTRMFLINTLYFQSNWRYVFDKANTKEDDFTKSDNLKVKASMMEQKNPFFTYYEDRYLQCVEMPYGNGAFCMNVILPAYDMDIDRLIEHLDQDNWQNIANSLNYQHIIWVKLPHFKVAFNFDLNDPEMNVCIQRIFNSNFADFTNISDDFLFVSNIKQKTFIEVDEEGTVATAATFVDTWASANGVIPPPPVEFFANRPFLYLIREKSTGVILFIGRLDEPIM